MQNLESHNKNFFVVDIETTGLVVEGGLILSVGIVALHEFNAVKEFEVIIHHTEQELLDRCLPEVIKMHKASGLWDKVISSPYTMSYAEDELIRFVKEHSTRNDRNIMIGNSVHFDKKWLDKHMPRFASKFYFRLLDISAINMLVQIFKPDLQEIVMNHKKWGHTALADCYESLKELRFYIDRLFKN